LLRDNPQGLERMTRWDGPQPAPRALFTLLRANFPRIRNDGIYNSRFVAGTTKLSLHAEGRALDIGLSADIPEQRTIGDRLFEIFIETASLMEIEEVIWNRRISSSALPRVHHYSGVDSHTGHIHVGFTRAGSQKTNFPPLFLLKIGVLRTGLEEIGRPVGASYFV
jgi:hypothetical protein